MSQSKSSNELNFSNNWNNKLACTAFSTIRISGRFKEGDRVSINLKKKFLGNAVCVAKRRFLLSNLNESVARIDSGYSKEECEKLIRTMYKKVSNLDEKYFYFYIFTYLKQSEAN